jgi:hypothetical protein
VLNEVRRSRTDNTVVAAFTGSTACASIVTHVS